MVAADKPSVSVQDDLVLNDLVGRWHIVATSFPMWLSGKKRRPSLNYALGRHRGAAGLIDVVEYEQGGKVKTIKGFDRPVDASNTEFIWRGSGWLALFKSRWRVAQIDKAAGWMLIEFERTLVTPAGRDLVCRDVGLGDVELRGILDNIDGAHHRLKDIRRP